MQEKYFAASNSRRGFISYYDDAFGCAERIYIVKGGPGTGKSYFMKKVAEAAERECHSVVYIYCSSDPSSLDGIIIDRRIALLDGTAPHAMEATLPGAREELIDLGGFFYGTGLSKSVAELSSLASKKSAAYRRAYDCLSAAGRLSDAAAELVFLAVLKEKLEAAAARALKDQKNGSEFTVHRLCTSSIGMRGEVRFDTLERRTETVITVTDTLGTAYLFLDALLDEAKRKKLAVCASVDPIMPERLDALLIGGTLFTKSKHEGARIINTERFIDRKLSRNIRKEYRALISAKDRAVECAGFALDDAARHHFALEDIYISHVNFAAKEKFTEDFIARLIEMLGNI